MLVICDIQTCWPTTTATTKKTWSQVRILNLELWIIVLYNLDSSGFSTGFGHMMFQECELWVLNLFYLLLHVLIVLYICNLFSIL